MAKTKGFNGWIPIFQGGRQRDSQGREHDGDALIEKAVSKFKPSHHEPPAVIGHPADNAPSYGWVEGLKKEVLGGKNMLMAKFRQVQPVFADMVESGMFKKRSAAFYPDGSLRHVGFLGAMPPAVKGLPDVAFAEGEPLMFEFSEEWKMRDIADVFRRLREWLLEKFDADTADRIVPSWSIDSIKEPPPEIGGTAGNAIYSEREEKSMEFKEFIQKLKDLVAAAGSSPADQPAGKTFSEADIETERKRIEAETRQKVETEFAEKGRQARQDARKREISSWCESMVESGKMTPAMVKFGVPEMLAAFAEKEDVIEFGETKEKATLFDRFKGLFETEFPKPTFGEMAGRDKDNGGQGTAATKLDALTRGKMKENKDLDYSAAFAEVQKENPDLVQEYAQDIRG